MSIDIRHPYYSQEEHKDFAVQVVNMSLADGSRYNFVNPYVKGDLGVVALGVIELIQDGTWSEPTSATRWFEGVLSVIDVNARTYDAMAITYFAIEAVGILDDAERRNVHG